MDHDPLGLEGMTDDELRRLLDDPEYLESLVLESILAQRRFERYVSWGFLAILVILAWGAL